MRTPPYKHVAASRTSLALLLCLTTLHAPPALAQVSDDVAVTLTVQTSGQQVSVLNLNDFTLTYDGATLAGSQTDLFCLFAGDNFALTLDSSNGVGANFFLAGSGSNIVYDVNIIADFDFEPITSDGLTFDHAVTETIDGTNLSTDPTCSEGDNMTLEILFPLGGANGLDVVAAAELSDGAPHPYQDLLTLTLSPLL